MKTSSTIVHQVRPEQSLDLKILVHGARKCSRSFYKLWMFTTVAWDNFLQAKKFPFPHIVRTSSSTCKVLLYLYSLYFVWWVSNSNRHKNRYGQCGFGTSSKPAQLYHPRQHASTTSLNFWSDPVAFFFFLYIDETWAVLMMSVFFVFKVLNWIHIV